jgi:hypothetical protein
MTPVSSTRERLWTPISQNWSLMLRKDTRPFSVTAADRQASDAICPAWWAVASAVRPMRARGL